MKAIASIFLLISVFVVSYLTMLYGWGLEVESWGWVIGCYVWLIFSQVIGESLK